MTCGIYKITSPSGRVYVGQSRDIDRRWLEYSRKDCKTQIKLKHSFKKYGVEAHVFKIIEECELEKLNIRERYWQDFYNCLENGLNCLLTQTDEKPLVRSIETRQKMSSARIGKKASKETLLKMRCSALSRKFTDENRLKMSEPNNKKLLDTLTNKIYSSIKEASKATNINYSTLTNMLSGHRRNKTSLIYYNESKS